MADKSFSFLPFHSYFVTFQKILYFSSFKLGWERPLKVTLTLSEVQNIANQINCQTKLKLSAQSVL